MSVQYGWLRTPYLGTTKRAERRRAYRRLASNSGKPCPYCNRRMDSRYSDSQPSRDHVLPKSRGGDDFPSNIRIVCRRCNNDKAARTLAEWAFLLAYRSDPRAARVADLVDAYGGAPAGLDVQTKSEATP